MSIDVERYFPADLDQLGVARTWSVACCREMGCAELGATVELLVDELLTNAFVHAGSSAAVCLVCDGPTLHGEVTDYGPGQVARRDPEPGRIGGWGLQVVDGLSTQWSVGYHRVGKTVSFTLVRPV